VPLKRFKAKLGSEGGARFVEIPFDVKSEFGSARAAVRVSINGNTFPSRVAVYGGRYYVGVRKDQRESWGVKAGDVVEVVLAPDVRIRRVVTPSELAAAFSKSGRAMMGWKGLSYTKRKEYADAIRNAKTPETRARRVRKTLEELLAK